MFGSLLVGSRRTSTCVSISINRMARQPLINMYLQGIFCSSPGTTPDSMKTRFGGFFVATIRRHPFGPSLARHQKLLPAILLPEIRIPALAPHRAHVHVGIAVRAAAFYAEFTPARRARNGAFTHVRPRLAQGQSGLPSQDHALPPSPPAGAFDPRAADNVTTAGREIGRQLFFDRTMGEDAVEGGRCVARNRAHMTARQRIR